MESPGKLVTVARVLDSADLRLCAAFNRCSRSASVCGLFRTVSRLGDGILWYGIMALLPLIGGSRGLAITGHMAATALAGLLVYKVTKLISGRERPYIQHGERVACALPPLDRYSFPSGHTLHAVCFSVVLCTYLPPMAWVLLPFTLLVALSRMVLGLHYPSDVLAGGGIGAGLALLSFEITRLPL